MLCALERTFILFIVAFFSHAHGMQVLLKLTVIINCCNAFKIFIASRIFHSIDIFLLQEYLYECSYSANRKQTHINLNWIAPRALSRIYDQILQRFINGLAYLCSFYANELHAHFHSCLTDSCKLLPANTHTHTHKFLIRSGTK
jgi:hypothetical protein